MGQLRTGAASGCPRKFLERKIPEGRGNHWHREAEGRSSKRLPAVSQAGIRARFPGARRSQARKILRGESETIAHSRTTCGLRAEAVLRGADMSRPPRTPRKTVVSGADLSAGVTSNASATQTTSTSASGR